VRVNAEVQALLSERVPRSFPVEISWSLLATGLIARMGGILDAITALIERGRRADAEVALRSLYEHVTIFCWLGIDPDAHLAEWRSHSEARWGIFHREARDRYGYEVISEEDAATLDTERMKPLNQLAEAVDAYWPDRIPAFQRDETKPLLTFRGCYTAIFRPASRIAHGEVDALQPYVNVRAGEIVVSMRERERFGRAAFAFPLFAFALLVYHEHFGWPGDERTRQMTDSLRFEPTGASD
jgi:hypothetical protein